jgi:hypothetical protein
MSGYELHDRYLIPARHRDFSLHHHTHTGYVAHAASHPMDNNIRQNFISI